ncbi:MAG TPA: peptidoglycan-associated lipoprotein Pal [bacterium]|nr:peptidoglycan-associated lipoprotein Pal [bacterium]
MNRRIASIAVLVALAAAGCHKKPPAKVSAENTVATPAPTPDATASLNGEEARKGLPDVKTQTLSSVYFDFDSVTLRDDAKATLEKNFEVLNGNAALRVRLEGNTDERGSTQYNVALGQRRAQAVKDFLVNRGIPANRLETVSYGKERPADAGHTEEAWAKNRRCDLAVIGGTDNVGSSR